MDIQTRSHQHRGHYIYHTLFQDTINAGASFMTCQWGTPRWSIEVTVRRISNSICHTVLQEAIVRVVQQSPNMPEKTVQGAIPHSGSSREHGAKSCTSCCKNVPSPARSGGRLCISRLYDEAELPLEDPPVVAFTTTATVDGESVTVERTPKGKCSRCGRHDPLTPPLLDKYREAFDRDGLTLPTGSCEECATELWKKQRRGG